MHQKSTEFEYSADYRTTDSHANKVTVKATAKPQSGHAEAHIEGALPTNFDTISTSKSATKKICLYRVVFACVLLLLAIAGATSLISALVRTAAVMNNSPTNAKCESYIAPLEMLDSPPFEECNHLGANVKVAERIWQNLFQKGRSTYKELDANGLTLMPASDVQSACTELFGLNATINTNESVRGQFFSHTTSDDYFHISSTSNETSIVPHVNDITEENENLNLVTSYFAREDKTDTPSPVKQMVYNLPLDDGTNKSYIQSVPRPCP